MGGAIIAVVTHVSSDSPPAAPAGAALDRGPVGAGHDDSWPYPRHSVRLLAFLIDQVLLISVFLALLAAAALIIFLTSERGQVDPPDSSYTIAIIILAAMIPIWILYHVLLWGTTGQTLGKYLLDLRALRRDGARLGLGRASLRLVGYTLSALTLHLATVLVFFGHERRALHDRIATTVVVHHFEPWMVEWVGEEERE
ncbi:MAG: RDD family protein [Dehalococcoidia bacterium]|nr:RDD family protein [Dehalococcoidia bacterium]